MLENKFNSKCGEIHIHNAMIFSITCNFCGLITNSFDQFCQHFKGHIFESSDTDALLNDDPSEDDIEEIRVDDSELERSEDNEENSPIKDTANFAEFELIRFENDTIHSLPAQENIFSPKQATRFVDDAECLNEIEVEINSLPMKQSVAEENTQPNILLQRDESKETIPITKKELETKNIPKTPNKPTMRIFNCEHCDRSFNNKSNRNTHELRHRDIGDFQCNLCIKTFYTKIELTRHLRSHNDERPYVCEQCGKSFRQLWVLKKHSLTHTVQERTLPCPNCGKLFSCKDHVRRHMVIHNTIPIFACGDCDKVFTQRKRLTAHKRLHHIERLNRKY